MSYEIKVRIRYSEIDGERKLTIPALINLLQDCSTFHTEDVAFGLRETSERQEGWYIFSWQIDLTRMPELGEYVTLRTWPSGYDRLLVHRDYEMLDDEGNSLVRVRSIWALMDLKHQLPKRPKEVMEVFIPEPAVAGEWTGRKIENVPELTEATSFVVRVNQIDSNHHMNNQHYIEEAYALLPEDREVTGIRTEYRAQVMLGEEVFLSYGITDQDVTVDLHRADGSTCAIVRFLTRTRK